MIVQTQYPLGKPADLGEKDKAEFERIKKIIVNSYSLPVREKRAKDVDALAVAHTNYTLKNLLDVIQQAENAAAEEANKGLGLVVKESHPDFIKEFFADGYKKADGQYKQFKFAEAFTLRKAADILNFYITTNNKQNDKD